MKRRRWYLVGLVGGRGTRGRRADGESGRRGLVEPEAHEGDGPAEVGHAGAVRRLLRGEGEGLLQGRPGLDVNLKVGGPDDHQRADRALRSRPSSGSTGSPSLLANRDQGNDLVNIAQVFTQVRHDRGDLEGRAGSTTSSRCEGKKFGVWICGNEFEQLRRARQERDRPANKDVTLVQQQFDMVAFLNHEIDAASAMTYNELAQVLETKNPDTGKLYTLADLNVFKYSGPRHGDARRTGSSSAATGSRTRPTRRSP